MQSDPINMKAGELIAAARRGSLEAVGELYRQHADMVYTLAYRVLGAEDDAGDVLQDVFVGLPHALRNYSEQGRFESWLRRVVVRTCLMRMRAQKRRREAGDVELAEVSARGIDVVERIALERALKRLPQQFRTIFVLREIEGYSHGEIADLMGISAANSATRLSRAWTFLRKELNK
jgi:RNA polymerase sigma-70 factor, ECF subfamily